MLALNFVYQASCVQFWLLRILFQSSCESDELPRSIFNILSKAIVKFDKKLGRRGLADRREVLLD